MDDSSERVVVGKMDDPVNNTQTGSSHPCVGALAGFNPPDDELIVCSVSRFNPAKYHGLALQ